MIAWIYSIFNKYYPWIIKNKYYYNLTLSYSLLTNVIRIILFLFCHERNFFNKHLIHKEECADSWLFAFSMIRDFFPLESQIRNY